MGDPSQIITIPGPAVTDTWTYNLQVNGPDGYAVTGPVAGTTDYLATDAGDNVNGLLGDYTIGAAPAGFHWLVNPIPVTADMFTLARTDFVYNAMIEFVLEPDPIVDTQTFVLNVLGPDGYAVTGPVNGVTDYIATDGPLADNVNDLLGDYTIAAAPAGYHWVVNPIAVTADMFVAQPTKMDYVYMATIEFVLEMDPVVDTYTYILHVNGPDGYAVAGPVNGVTDYIATDNDDNVNELVGLYTIAAAPAGWHWLVNPIEVTADMFMQTAPVKTDYVYEATIEFVLEEDPVIVPDFTFFVEAHDVANPAGPDLNAEIYFNGMPFVPPIYTPYTFNFYANFPAMTTWVPGTYSVVKECYDYWIPESITFVDINTNYEVDFLGMWICQQNPVELSSFTAVANATDNVTISWTSQSESQMLGYAVYRNTSNNQAGSQLINPTLIPATNTSTTHNYSLNDYDVATGTTYYYWLEAVDYNNSSYHGPVSVTINGDNTPELPTQTLMNNAYPNPFKVNGSTNIEVSLKAGDSGTLTIYNVLGQVVKTISVTEGTHRITWNGKDSRGNACGSGIYFYKLSTPSTNLTKKLVIVK